MSPRADPLPRKAFDQILEALSDTRIVVLNGARQVGKSTLAQAVARDLEVAEFAVSIRPKLGSRPKPTQPNSSTLVGRVFCQ
ncbi:MAG: hypothetical protein ACRC0L_10600 [Angustibacter sp.]